MRICWFAVAAPLLFAQIGWAGTRVAMETREIDAATSGVRRSLVRLERDRLRVDVAGGGNSVIYRGDRDLVWLLDHSEQTFVTVSRGTTAALSRSLERANEALRERLRNLPPEQRATAERLLESTLGPAPEAAARVSTRPTGKREVVAGIPCDESEVLRGGERVALVCSATFDAAGIERGSFEAVRQLVGFLRESIASLAPGTLRTEGIQVLDALEPMDGVPLRVRAFEKGVPTTETRVTQIRAETFEPAQFELPAGYRGGFSIGGSEAAE